jgi:hypothetical protein
VGFYLGRCHTSSKRLLVRQMAKLAVESQLFAVEGLS